MDYLPTIYACGDAYYLGKVLDAVAMICGTNGGLVGATAVGALIGVIIIAFQTVIRLNGINIHHMLVCWVIYVISFGTTTDVAIQSVYSDGSVVQKDNVPAGPAWIGVIVSNIGYHMTKKMEQAFGDVDERAVITNNNGNGFANALYILNHMSQFGEKGPLRAAMAKTTTGRDLLTNLTVYTRDCTTKAIYLGPKWGGKTYEQIITQPFEKAFEFESKIYFTEVRNAGQTLELSCTDAWKTITEQMNGKAFDEIDTFSVQELANKAGFCTRKADGSSSCDVETPDELMNKFQRTSLNALTDSSVKAQKYMLTSVGRNILNLGLAQGYATYKDTNSAAMLAQAIEQRNVQWAAEQSMFLNSVRPMMAFMESFFYALTPFAAVFVMLGLFGLGLFFKYILLLIWVQMWLPVMAIANMYIMSAAKREMNSIISGFAGQNFDAAKNGSISIYAYDQMLGAAKDWVATGAMFQAATPLLSLIIISGSVYALTSLTGRMAGADHINEKIVAPDVVAPAAAMGIQPRYTVDSNGYKLSGFTDTSINLQRMMGQARSHAHSQLNATTGALQSLNSTMFSRLGADLQDNVTSGGYLKSDASQEAQAAQQIITDMANTLRSQGVTNADETATSWAVSIGLNSSFGGATVGNSGKSMLTAQQAINEAKNHGINLSDSQVATLTKGVSVGVRKAASKGKSKVESGGISDSFNQLGSKLSALQEQTQQVDSMSESSSWNRTMTATELAANLEASSPGAVNALYEQVHSSNQEVGQMLDKVYNITMNEKGGLVKTAYDDQRAKILALANLDTDGDGQISNATEYMSQKGILELISKNVYTPNSTANSADSGYKANDILTPEVPVGVDPGVVANAKNGIPLSNQPVQSPEEVTAEGEAEKRNHQKEAADKLKPLKWDSEKALHDNFYGNGNGYWFSPEFLKNGNGYSGLPKSYVNTFNRTMKDFVKDSFFQDDSISQLVNNGNLKDAYEKLQSRIANRFMAEGIQNRFGQGEIGKAALNYAIADGINTFLSRREFTTPKGKNVNMYEVGDFMGGDVYGRDARAEREDLIQKAKKMDYSNLQGLVELSKRNSATAEGMVTTAVGTTMTNLNKSEFADKNKPYTMTDRDNFTQNILATTKAEIGGFDRDEVTTSFKSVTGVNGIPVKSLTERPNTAENSGQTTVESPIATPVTTSSGRSEHANTTGTSSQTTENPNSNGGKKIRFF